MTHSFSHYSREIGQQILVQRPNRSRKENGQFITPEPLAKFMAEQLGSIQDGDHILDPAMGSGTLLCAVIENLIEENKPLEIWVDGFELDEELFGAAESILTHAVIHAAQRGIQVHLKLFHTDFILNGLSFLRPSLLDSPVGYRYYQRIIANPPYFKININDPRRKAAEGLLSGYTNIYTLFMGLASKMLKGGRASFIVPRSFCSGTYFTQFRKEFLQTIQPQSIHLFQTRDNAFSQDDVLQENLIITFKPREMKKVPYSIQISSSAMIEELIRGVMVREITDDRFISPQGLFRLPISEVDETILDIVDSWSGSFHEYGLEISTGPVVPFRVKEYLADKPSGNTVTPLLWMQHIKPQQVIWPLNGEFQKPQYIHSLSATNSLLVKNTNYILIRRFSTKEEPRRLVAAPYLAEHYDCSLVGLENHLNYVYSRDSIMSKAEVFGLSALLNSGLIDRYFRISNGNTQVNATELRALPLPPLSAIKAIGQVLAEANEDLDIDAVVIQTLQNYVEFPIDFPILRETRVV